MSEFANQAAAALARLREQRPLIHHITNQVVMNDTANLTLHLGALPVMAHAVEEVAEMVDQAGALVLNIGTLTATLVEAMRLAGRRANERGIPIVLDPVGAGATSFRTQSALALLEELRIAVVRGNAGEIAALAGQEGLVRGVDSIAGAGQARALAGQVARRWDTVVAVTGARDVISDGQRLLGVDNGHPWLTTVTGTGCMATTAVAAFCAIEPDPLLAATVALACYGLAAERAAGGIGIARSLSPAAFGPASFRVALLDSVYHLSPEQVAAGVQIVDLAAERA
ncbi:MAG: hydroxyethylthiazole kinase [Anaerolineae bacterium]